MENKKNNYQDIQLGFDRTQLYKEYTHPQIVRSTALNAVMDFCKMNGIKLNTKEMIAMVNKYVMFIETGDTSWVKTVDEYIIKKYEDIDN
jgi:hypothetical protein